MVIAQWIRDRDSQLDNEKQRDYNVKARCVVARETQSISDALGLSSLLKTSSCDICRDRDRN